MTLVLRSKGDFYNPTNSIVKSLLPFARNTQLQCWFYLSFFFSFFRWLDKLGLAAQQGYKVVIRQSLFGGSYSLVGRDMEPNPVG